MRISTKLFYIDLSINDIAFRLLQKTIAIFYRFVDFFRLFPRRIFRFSKLIWKGILYTRPHQLTWWKTELLNRPAQRMSYRASELGVSFLEIFGVVEIYETINDFVKFNTRPLTNWEINLAKDIFGNSINYKRVRIDEYAFVGPRQHRFCYVSFNLINSWGPMQNSIFIHEMVHVWQYENLGAIYIPKALSAQYTTEGYNYGGVETLKQYMQEGKDFLDFNYEQQGDIVADYYRIKNGYQPCWGSGNRLDLPVYEYFLRTINDKL